MFINLAMLTRRQKEAKRKGIMSTSQYRSSVVDETETFGAYIRAKREEKGLSVRGLAGKLGITPAYLSDIENGNSPAPKRNTPKRILENLCRELIDKDEESRFNELAEMSWDDQCLELSHYLKQHANARLALRVARQRGFSEEEWKKIARGFEQMPSGD